MTAALGCFDMERHESGPALTFSITFQSRNRNSPFAAFPLTPPSSTPSSTSSACSDSSTQGHAAGTFTAASQPAPTALGFHSPKHVFFHFIWDAKSSFTEIRGRAGGQTGLGVNAAGGRGGRRSLLGSGSQAWRAGSSMNDFNLT